MLGTCHRPIRHTRASLQAFPIYLHQMVGSLKQQLAEEDLRDMEIFLERRGIRTLHALEMLETSESTVLLCAARGFYTALGIFPTHLKTALNKIFGDTSLLQQGKGFGKNKGLTPSDFADSSALKRELDDALEAAKDIVGCRAHTECRRRLERAQALMFASCYETAGALSAIMAQKKHQLFADRWEVLKLARKCVRTVLLWRCAGIAKGLDNRVALDKVLAEAIKYADLDLQKTMSQLDNAYNNVRDELFLLGPMTMKGGPKIKAAKPQLDQMKPNSSDPVVPDYANPADMHKQGLQGLQASFDSPLPGLPSSMFRPGTLPPDRRRSLPPDRRSPGPRHQDKDCTSLQFSTMMEMIQAMSHNVEDLKSQVGKFLQDRDPMEYDE